MSNTIYTTTRSSPTSITSRSAKTLKLYALEYNSNPSKTTNNVDIKIDEIRNVLRDNHSAIMQPRWEKEKTAFVIGEGLVSFVNHASSWLTMDMFFDLCANVGFVNLNREEIRTICDPTVDSKSKPKLVDNFRKKADLNIDYDLSCALNIGVNYALIRDALTEARAKNIHPDII